MAQISEIHEAVTEIREVRTQIRGLDRRLGEDSRYTPLLASAKEFDTKTLSVEGQLLQVKAKSSEANLNFPVLIDERLHSLLFSVDAGDYGPTQQQVQAFEELQKQAQPLLAQYHDLMTKDLVALNDQINKLSVPVLYVAPARSERQTTKAAGETR